LKTPPTGREKAVDSLPSSRQQRENLKPALHKKEATMPLDDSQKSTFDEWMDAKGIKKCPVCGSENLGLADKPYQLAGAETGGRLKAVIVTCANCGFLMPFSTSLTGIDAAKTKKSTKRVSFSEMQRKKRAEGGR
jgi:hypothetical protein